MLRRVMALAAVGACLVVPASAVDLITYPTLARGTLTFAPVSFASLDIDWLDAFAADNDGAARLTVSQLSDFLSWATVAGGKTALIGPAGSTEITDPPQTDQRALHRLGPFDLQQ